MIERLKTFIIRFGIMPLWALWERSDYFKHLKSLNQNQYKDNLYIRQEQEKKFSRLLQHAYEHCPYYRNIFVERQIDPDTFIFDRDFKKIPILKKNDIRTYKDKMVAVNIPRNKLIPKKTSGSTGVSLELFMDTECSQYRRAVTIFRNSWSGWRLGQRMGAIWGNPKIHTNREYLRNLFLERCEYLDTLGMKEEDMLHFLNRLNKLRPSVIYGHAYSLYFFAKFVQNHDEMIDFKLKGIISTAMILHPWQRAKIEEVFQCPVFNRYGCEEVSLIASECERHQGMHINTDSLIVEFLKDGKPAAPGEEASIIVTDLVNYGMPFIRYELGDLGILSNQKCSCGRCYPLIEKIVGRDADFVITPNGKVISGISLTENFSLKVPGVEQMQIEQTSINKLKMRIVRDKNFNRQSQEVLSSLCQKTFGLDMHCENEFVNSIKKEKNGKYRFVISKIKTEK